MSVQTTNIMCNLVLEAAFTTAAHTLAGAVIGNPIGAMGGALFGAVRYVSSYPLFYYSAGALGQKNPQANKATIIMALAIQFFGSIAVAWGILALAGFSLTLSHVAILTAVSIVSSVLLSSIVGCIKTSLREALAN